MSNKPKTTLHRRKLNAARMARWRANRRNGTAVYLLKVSRKDIAQVLRVHGLTKPSKKQIEEKLSQIFREIAARWKDNVL
jgi:hypothetical protein